MRRPDVGLEKTVIGTGPEDGVTALPSVSLASGDMFRGLRVRALLGAGAMGNAYLASHVSLRTPVVVKLFRVVGADLLAEAHLVVCVVSL